MNIIIAGVKPTKKSEKTLYTWIPSFLFQLQIWGLPKITFMSKNSLEGLSESGFNTHSYGLLQGRLWIKVNQGKKYMGQSLEKVLTVEASVGLSLRSYG